MKRATPTALQTTENCGTVMIGLRGKRNTLTMRTTKKLE
jgi:hypothetical protein